MRERDRRIWSTADFPARDAYQDRRKLLAHEAALKAELAEEKAICRAQRELHIVDHDDTKKLIAELRAELAEALKELEIADVRRDKMQAELATAKAERESAVRAFVAQLQGETGVAFEEGERRGFERACEAMANRVSPLSGLDGETIVKVRNIIYELRDSKAEPR